MVLVREAAALTYVVGACMQAYMEIRCPDGGAGGRDNAGSRATHEETHATAMLSVVASLTPWSDHNQSPRNMYQCQVKPFTFPAFCQQTPPAPRSQHAFFSLYFGFWATDFNTLFHFRLFPSYYRWESKQWDFQLKLWHIVQITKCTAFRYASEWGAGLVI
jgi:hypothetical protein